MKWFGLYKKIGKQQLEIMQKSDVIAIIDGEETPLLLKFKESGSPYLISKKEYNYSQCKKCYNYIIGDGYDDISICRKCKFHNNKLETMADAEYKKLIKKLMEE